MVYFKFLTAMLLLLVSTYPHAVIVWDESVNGDAGQFGNAVNLGSLSVGNNTILTSGEWSRSSLNCCNNLDLDFFTFDISEGYSITEIQWEVSNLTFEGEIFSQSIQLSLNSISDDSFYGQIVGYYDPVLFDGFDTLNPSLPAVSNSYRLVANNSGGTHLNEFTSTWNGVATIVVTSIPEPSTIFLLVIGLLSFSSMKKKSYLKYHHEIPSW